MISNNDFLTIEPPNLQFHFELKKQITCSLYLTNKTNNNVAFKVKTTNPRNYKVSPNRGLVPPRSTFKVLVTKQAQKEAPYDMQCNEKFMIQAASASPRLTAQEVTDEMFSNEMTHPREQRIKMRVTYVESAITSPSEPEDVPFETGATRVGSTVTGPSVSHDPFDIGVSYVDSTNTSSSKTRGRCVCL